MADHDTSIHFTQVEQRGGDPADNENEHVQFEECDKKTCKYYNLEGYCSFETCRITVENPFTAPMITKTCKICGDQFAGNYNEIIEQICPGCLKQFPKGEGHPHKCVFCGKTIDKNPSFFFAACHMCFLKLKAVATGSVASLALSSNIAHCDECPFP